MNLKPQTGISIFQAYRQTRNLARRARVFHLPPFQSRTKKPAASALAC